MAAVLAETKTEYIDGLQIEYAWEDDDTERELTDADRTEISRLLDDGYNEGEIYSCDFRTEEEYGGWWCIA